MAIILHFQSTGTVPGSGQPFSMRGTSLTVGRSDQNDMVLPDPDKMISSRHCAIEDHGGNVVVIDFSTNGTFLNYGKLALGPTPTPINDGDILSIGSYELLVELTSAGAQDPLQNIAAPLAADGPLIPSSGDTASVMDVLDDRDDFLDDLLGGPASGPNQVVRAQLGDDGLMPPLVDDFDPIEPQDDAPDTAHASQMEHSSPLSDVIQTNAPSTSAIPDDWDLDTPDVPISEIAPPVVPSQDPFFEEEPTSENVTLPEFDTDDFLDLDPEEAAPAADPIPDMLPDLEMETPPEPEALPEPQDAPAPSPDPVPAVSDPVPVQASGSDTGAARAFLTAVGAGDLDISDHELAPTLTRLGNAMRMMILGVREILMTRTSIKSEFRIHQTVISAGKNNPLKFSVSADQAVESMVKPTTKGYLDAADAAEEALNDIKAHEVAMMTGMEAALKGVLVKLEPKTLAKTIEADSSFRSVLTNKKARYWDTFEKKYEEIADQAENDFHDLFSKEFARAYQEQLEKLK
jgi:type VI secretion system protein